MGAKTKKRVRKKLQFYRANFGLEAPYSVIVDASFCKTALDYKINLKEDLAKFLDGERAYPTTSSCVVTELAQQGEESSGAALNAKRCFRMECGHLLSKKKEKKKTLNGEQVPQPRVATSRECIESLLKTPGKGYIVATNDDELKKEARKIPGVLILTVYQGQLVMDSFSNATTKAVKELGDITMKEIDQKERELIEEEKKKRELEQKANEKEKPKMNKPKAPNSLSAKKKKRVISAPSSEGEPKKKRVRSKKLLQNASKEGVEESKPEVESIEGTIENEKTEE
eukprot:TRINITY_DN1601_c0_g1_i1.p1 TRINITY_DN1601_c0_g1~~TRINITY_DN1601_c0_g1_i1.p1  ORF type:complete len:284 (-),score=129.14 TRINITY_DN1601_c0_g1_i1:267-1118(-)